MSVLSFFILIVNLFKKSVDFLFFSVILYGRMYASFHPVSPKLYHPQGRGHCKAVRPAMSPHKETRYPMKTNVHKITFTALMAALLCILSPISIPLPSPMPAITLAFVAVYLSAYITGPFVSCTAIFIYILLGCVGLPVFSKAQAGLSVLVGPTGGYIIGYFFLALFTGLAVQKYEKKIYLHVVGMVIGTLICYIFGTVWLGVSMNLTPKAAIAAGVAPFVVFDALKLAACVAIGYPIRRQLIRMLPAAVLPAKQMAARP